MYRIALDAFGHKKNGGLPTVRMLTGIGNAENGRFCLTNNCHTPREVDAVADALMEEIEEWRREAKRELRDRSVITEKG